MKKGLLSLLAVVMTAFGISADARGQESAMVTVTIENIAPENGVVLTPVWVGFHNGNFDSYNGGLTALEGLERLAEDGDNELISKQFLDFNPTLGGYTYIDITDPANPVSALVRTGDLTDQFRQDATMPSETGPIQPGQMSTASFMLRNDGSNDFFSYASMVLPTNDFFVANGNPLAHDISQILDEGGEVSFFIGTPNSGTNDAGTEAEDFNFSAGNALFPGRNLPAGQAGPNEGPTVSEPIATVTGDAFAAFQQELSFQDRLRVKLLTRLIARLTLFLERFAFVSQIEALIERLQAQLAAIDAGINVDVEGFNFNEYENGIARVTITAVPVAVEEVNAFSINVANVVVEEGEEFVSLAAAGNLYYNVHTEQFPGGEIRGQLEVVLDRQIGDIRILDMKASLDSAQEPDNSSDSEATGSSILRIVQLGSGKVIYSAVLSVDGIDPANLIPVGPFSAIHIHNAPPGVNGPVVRDFIVDAGGTPTDFSVITPQ